MHPANESMPAELPQVLRPPSKSTHAPEGQRKPKAKFHGLTSTEKIVADDFGVECLKSKPFYNVGAGNWRHPFFQNLDIKHDYYEGRNQPDIVHDLLSLAPLPMDSASANTFYTSHCIEHVKDTAVEVFFAEAYRTLKPGGCLRIVVPDMDLAYQAYLRKDSDFFLYSWNRAKNKTPEQLEKLTIDQLFLSFFAGTTSTMSPVPLKNKVTPKELSHLLNSLGPEATFENIVGRIPDSYQSEYAHTHKNWWNYDKLLRKLAKVGFSKIKRSGYGQSEVRLFRELKYFDRTYPFMSLYVEAFR